jgi:benzoyl-CoA reductase/2-hydroxyglutaryl-CoA dehydratase subunit BcrC/BadD/HgdB
MEAIEQLSKCIAERPAELKGLRDGGIKVVGIVGLGYVPEELIYASGAVPQRLIKGGESEAIDGSRPYCHSSFSTFHKAQIGYLLGGKESVYNTLDYLIVESGDWNSEMVGMYVYFYRKLPTIWLGIPGNPDFQGALSYYLAGLGKLREKLEELTGGKVSEEKLREYTALYNEMRDLLKNISYLRKQPSPPIGGLDFIKLNHYSFYCEPRKYVDGLKSVYGELKGVEGEYPADAPRIAIFGCPIAQGDYILPKLIEDAGGVIVTEELSGSVRHYEANTRVDGDMMGNLARRYYSGRERDAYKYPWGDELPSMFTRLVADYRVDGVIWYQLMYMVANSMLGYVVGKRMKEEGIPMMTLQSEYDLQGRLESNKTRIETFIEVVKQHKKRR